MRDPKTFSPWLGAWIAISIFAFVMLGCPTDSITGELNGGGGNDTTAPVPGDGGTIVASGETVSSVALAWTDASDDTTQASDLQYRVFYSTEDNITSVTAAAANGSEATIGWTDGITDHTVSSLSSNTTYYFVVVVQDEAANAAAYNPVSTATILGEDTTAPAVPVDALSVVTVVDEITITWTAANDDQSDTGDLVYELYYSSSNNLNSLANTHSNGTLGETVTGTTSGTISGLSRNSPYYVNVLVKDGANNYNTYSSVQADTKDGPNVIFTSGQTGDATALGHIYHLGVPSFHEESYVITNDGDMPLTINALSVVSRVGDENKADWSITDVSPPLEATIPVSGTASFTLRADQDPTHDDTGQAFADVTVTSSDPDGDYTFSVYVNVSYC